MIRPALMLCLTLTATAIAADGEDPDAPMRAAWERSVALAADGDYIGAEDALNPLTDRPEWRYLAAMRIAWLRSGIMDSGGALIAWEDASRANPKAIEPLAAMLLPLLELGRFAEAERAARRLLEQDPHHYQATLTLARSLAWQGDHRGAQIVADKLAWRYPSTLDVLIVQGWAHLGLGGAEQAEAILLRARLLAPGDETVASLLAQARGG